jgi:transmembrane sensor
MRTEKEEPITLLIAKHLAGYTDKQEEIYFENWISESDENRVYYEQLKNIWATADTRYLPEPIDSFSAFENVLGRISGTSPLRKLWVFWGKIAAVLMIPLLIVNIIWYSKSSVKEVSSSFPVFNEVYATFGTRTALNLADGSLVWLNSGSSMKYPDKFTGSQREVFLNGEAYFEVKSNPDMPFIVKTADLTVRATGTKFNVFGYNSDVKSEVTLVEGKVSVSEIDTSGSGTVLSELSPNQHLVFDKSTKQVAVDVEDSYKFYSWKDGKLIFRNEPLSEVVKKIGQVFNVDIELQGSKLQDYRYRATFEDESLSEILKLLEISSPISYKEIKRIPLPDGTFPKKKVIIFPVKKKV